MAATTPTPEAAVVTAMPQSEGFVDTERAGRLFYKLSDGPADAPLAVLLHGVTMDCDEYDSLVSACCQQQQQQKHPLRMLRFDLPGHGRSQIAAPVPPITREFMVAALEQALAALGVRRPFALVGHSMGGFVAAAFALAHPDAVARLVLLAPAGMPVAEPLAAKLVRLPGLSALIMATVGERALVHNHDEEFAANASADALAAKEMLQRKNERALAETPHFKETVLSIIHNLGLNGSMEAGFGELGRRTDMPVLMVWGDQDAKCPYPTTVPRLKQLVPNAQWAVLPGVAHQILYEAPHDAAQHILAFLWQ